MSNKIDTSGNIFSAEMIEDMVLKAQNNFGTPDQIFVPYNGMMFDDTVPVRNFKMKLLNNGTTLVFSQYEIMVGVVESLYNMGFFSSESR